MADESTQYEARLKAIKTVTEAAKIHADGLKATLPDSTRDEGFKQARRDYIEEVRGALRTVREINFDGEVKLMQRVSDLTLEEAVDLQLAVEEQIRVLRKRSFERTVY